MENPEENLGKHGQSPDARIYRANVEGIEGCRLINETRCKASLESAFEPGVDQESSRLVFSNSILDSKCMHLRVLSIWSYDCVVEVASPENNIVIETSFYTWE